TVPQLRKTLRRPAKPDPPLSFNVVTTVHDTNTHL
ncbi:hypothetical protein TIFTF001_051000, partial [Ficus carica]